MLVFSVMACSTVSRLILGALMLATACEDEHALSEVGAAAGGSDARAVGEASAAAGGAAVDAAPEGAVDAPPAEPGSIRFTPASFDFGSADIGCALPPAELTLANTGMQPQPAPELTVSAPFIITVNGCKSALPPGGACVVVVAFRPEQRPAQVTGDLVARAGAAAAHAELRGRATSSLTEPGIFPTSLDFGEIPVGQSSPAKTVRIFGGGGTDGWQITLTQGIPFRIAKNTCMTDLPAGVSCDVDIVFTPTQTGTHAGALTVTRPRYCPDRAGLSGSGVPPDSVAW